MKILDRYLLKTFASTLISVFVILFFIFVLQTVWLFISELAGKDLTMVMILKFLLFSMPRIIPLVLPLSVLLASIMTFGDLSENYEFAAMKSSGISFLRALKMPSIFIFFLAIGAFFFANNVIPYSEYKFINFRKEIAQRTPAMAIAAGQFSEIGNFVIKVDEKTGENGNQLKGVTIHKKALDGSGSKTVIKSKTGELISNENSNNLKLELSNGFYYEDIVPKNYEDRNKLPFAKSSFRKYIINIDLAKLNQSQFDQGEITNTNNMLNVSELNYTLDSLKSNFTKDRLSFADNSYSRTGIAIGQVYSHVDTSKTKKLTKIPSDIMSVFSKDQKESIFKVAIGNIDNSGFSLSSSITDLQFKQKAINTHLIAFYEKFVIAFGCILMFFIGAPLGSIIRKGGLGLPIVAAVSIFIIYHFINTFGKRVAAENGMPPILGAWISTLVLLPLAVLLTNRAVNDLSGMINFDGIVEPFQKIIKRFFKKE